MKAPIVDQKKKFPNEYKQKQLELRKAKVTMIIDKVQRFLTMVEPF